MAATRKTAVCLNFSTFKAFVTQNKLRYIKSTIFYTGFCRSNEFACTRSGTCIPLEKYCDRKVDCENMDDELDCCESINIFFYHGEFISNNRKILNFD